MFPLFPLGQIVATPRALAALERAKQPPTSFLARHATGDWGELEPTDVAENQYSVALRFQDRDSWIALQREFNSDRCRKHRRARFLAGATRTQIVPHNLARTALIEQEGDGKTKAAE